MRGFALLRLTLGVVLGLPGCHLLLPFGGNPPSDAPGPRPDRGADATPHRDASLDLDGRPRVDRTVPTWLDGAVATAVDGSGPGGWIKESSLPSDLAKVDFYDVWGATANNVYAVGDIATGPAGSTGIVAYFDGTTWSRVADSIPPLRGVSGVPSGAAAFAVGSGNALVTCAGTACKSVTCVVDGALADFKGVWAASATDALIVGQEAPAGGKSSAVVYRYETGTCSSVEELPGIDGFNAIWGVNLNPSEYYVAGPTGLLDADMNSLSWSSPTTCTAELFDVWGVAGNLLLAVGADNTIGERWLGTTNQSECQITPASSALYGCWSDGTQSLAVGAGRTVLKRPTTSGNWSPETLPAAVASTVELRAVWGASTGEVFVVGKQGTILHYH